MKLRFPKSYYKFNIKKLAEIVLILKNDKGDNNLFSFKYLRGEVSEDNDKFKLGSLEFPLE